jgi:hypothetical protein
LIARLGIIVCVDPDEAGIKFIHSKEWSEISASARRPVERAAIAFNDTVPDMCHLDIF